MSTPETTPDDDAAHDRLREVWMQRHKAQVVMSPQQASEFAACVAIDDLRVSLEAMRLAMDAAWAACPSHIDDKAARDFHVQWAASLLLLRDTFDTTERRGMTTYRAVCTMLAIE